MDDRLQRQFVEHYGLAECSDAPGVPADVPDGECPMTIDGKLGGKISCCNFESAAPRN